MQLIFVCDQNWINATFSHFEKQISIFVHMVCCSRIYNPFKSIIIIIIYTSVDTPYICSCKVNVATAIWLIVVVILVIETLCRATLWLCNERPPIWIFIPALSTATCLTITCKMTYTIAPETHCIWPSVFPPKAIVAWGPWRISSGITTMTSWIFWI